MDVGGFDCTTALVVSVAMDDRGVVKSTGVVDVVTVFGAFAGVFACAMLPVGGLALVATLVDSTEPGVTEASAVGTPIGTPIGSSARTIR